MMVKDNIIMSFMTRLKSIIDFNLVEIVDYWDGDLLAIGIKRGCKLVYLAANKSINSRLITYDFDNSNLFFRFWYSSPFPSSPPVPI